jgi:hypothetical protein
LFNPIFSKFDNEFFSLINPFNILLNFCSKPNL